MSKPTYSKMIGKAIIALKERKGSSTIAIEKFIYANYHKELPKNYTTHVRKNIRKMCWNGIIIQNGVRYRIVSRHRSKFK